MDSFPSVESPGDPWDHPDLLASIDDLCTTHFRLNKRADAPPLSNSCPILPPHSANLTHLSFAPQTDIPSQPLSKETPANLHTLPKQGPEGFTQIETRLRGSFSQPGSKFLEDSPTFKKPGFRKRTQNIWKPKRRHPKLILGMDIGLPEACNLALCALVGRLAYKDFCKQKLEDWIASTWKPILGYLPKFHLLQHVWLGFFSSLQKMLL